MRLIGHLAAEASAKRFGDFLFAQGIENHVEHEQADAWGIWIAEEDNLQAAADLLADFQKHPSDPKFAAAARRAAGLRAEKEKADAAYRKKVLERRNLFRPLTGYGFGPFTLALIIISVGVFLLSRFGMDHSRVSALFITNYSLADDYIQWDSGLPEILHGQIWRLFTPIFIHFNILHIFFNMLWLRDLGSMIEARQSSWYLGLFVLVVGAGSNLAQFYIGHSPMFGGMSGVVYGLLGYVWLRGKFDPASGLFLHPTTVMMMAIWFVAGFTGVLGPIANWAHAGGLVIGALWGYLATLRYR